MIVDQLDEAAVRNPPRVEHLTREPERLQKSVRVISSDRLLDELWPEQPPASGATALQVRVSELRKELGPAAGRLETTSPGYLLRVERGELDLERFSLLVEEADGAEEAMGTERLREA